MDGKSPHLIHITRVGYLIVSETVGSPGINLVRSLKSPIFGVNGTPKPYQPLRDCGCQLGCQTAQKIRNLAGMDGNRIHRGRLNSAPQTVLKTAFLRSIDVRERPLRIEISELKSAKMRNRAPMSTSWLSAWLSRRNRTVSAQA